MSSRDAEREREIERSGDVAALKRLRSSRKGQITKVERDVEKYSSSTISNLKKPAVEATLTTLDYQLYFYDLIQDRIIFLLRESRDDPKSAIYKGRETLEDEEATGDAEITTAKNLRLQLQEYLRAIDTLNKVRRVKHKLKAMSDSDRIGDSDMAEQLKALGGLIDELLNAEGELSHLDEISTHIHEIHMSYQAFTKDVLKARPVPIVDATPTMPYTSFHKQTYPPSRETLWRRFWERFSQRISMFPGIPAADKIVQLERAIKPPDGRALILAAKGTEEEYVASVKALQKRYDQPRRIYRAYVQDAFGHLTPRTRKGIYAMHKSQ